MTPEMLMQEIQRRMISRRLTCAELAKRAQVSPENVRCWAQGEKLIGHLRFLAMLDALDLVLVRKGDPPNGGRGD